MMRQADHERPRRLAVVDQIKLSAPATKFFLGVAAERRLVDGAVHRFAKGVDRIHRLPPGLRQKDKRIVKVASALFGEIGAVLLRSRSGHRHRG